MTDNRRMTPMHPLRPWLMWAAGSSFFFYAFFQRTAPSVMVPELMRDFGVTAAALGNLSAYYFWAYTALQLPVGVAADRWGPRRLLSLAAAFAGAGGLLFALAETVPLASLGRLMVGAGAGFGFVCTLKIITDWFPPHRLAMLSGLLMMLGMLGGVAGQAPLAAAVASYGWRETMATAALFAIFLAVFAGFIVRDKRPEGAHAGGGAGGASLLRGLRRSLGRGQTWLIAGYGFFLLPPMFAFGALWGVPYLTQIHGFTRPDAAFAASLILIGWGLFAPVVGWLSDRWRRRKPPLVAAALLNCLTMLVVIYVPNLSPGLIQVMLFTNGVFTAGMVVCFATAREHNAAEDAGAAMAVVNMGVIGSGAFSQPLVGWLLDLAWTGEIEGGVRIYTQAAYDGAFWVIPASCAVATVLALMIRETHAKAEIDP